jgi:CP family cyanate transporter-like MFS transporter
MVSATFLSPWLGGWRNVLFLYGAISIILGIIWLVTVKETRDTRAAEPETTVPVRQAISRLLRNKGVWLLGLNYFAYAGATRSLLGYLPLYLREIGWSAIGADSALTLLNIMSMAGVVPLAMLSDRLGRRKEVLVTIIITTIICTALLSIVSNALLWVVVVILGFFQLAYGALINTSVFETEGVGVAHAGMAIGLVSALQRIGIFIASPLGNSLASINPGMPFVFWSMLLAGGTVILIFVKETGWKSKASIPGRKAPS